MEERLLTKEEIIHETICFALEESGLQIKPSAPKSIDKIYFASDFYICAIYPSSPQKGYPHVGIRLTSGKIYVQILLGPEAKDRYSGKATDQARGKKIWGELFHFVHCR